MKSVYIKCESIEQVIYIDNFINLCLAMNNRNQFDAIAFDYRFIAIQRDITEIVLKDSS